MIHAVTAPIDGDDDEGAGRMTASATELIERAYVQLLPRLVGLGRLLTRGADVGEDLAQDAFVRLLRAAERDPLYVREPVWPLLRTTLVRLAIQRRRTLLNEARRLVKTYERPSHEWTEPTFDYSAALATLPVRMRACVALFYGDDMRTADVAAALGCSTKTVENQLRAARERLAPRLRELAAVEGGR